MKDIKYNDTLSRDNLYIGIINFFLSLDTKNTL